MALPDSAPNPLESVSKAEEERRLEAAMDVLDERHREAIVLRDYEGFSWAQVAERIGSPSPDAARMFHGTAKARLAAALRASGAGADP